MVMWIFSTRCPSVSNRNAIANISISFAKCKCDNSFVHFERSVRSDGTIAQFCVMFSSVVHARGELNACTVTLWMCSVEGKKNARREGQKRQKRQRKVAERTLSFLAPPMRIPTTPSETPIALLAAPTVSFICEFSSHFSMQSLVLKSTSFEPVTIVDWLFRLFDP